MDDSWLSNPFVPPAILAMIVVGCVRAVFEVRAALSKMQRPPLRGARRWIVASALLVAVVIALASPLWLPSYLLSATAVYAVVLGWRRTIVILPFETPQGSELPFGPEAIAGTLQREILSLEQEAAEMLLKERRAELDFPHSELVSLINPAFAKQERPILTNVQLRGVSHFALVTMARTVMGTATHVSGEVILDRKAGLVLAARIGDQGLAVTERFPKNLKGLRAACRGVARRVLLQCGANPLLLATYEIREGRLAKARELVTELVRTARGRRAKASARRAYEICIVLIANELIREGQHSECQLLLGNATSLVPDSSQLYTTFGQLMNRRGYFKYEIDMLEKAVTFDPRSARARLCLGDALRRQGRNYDAIDHMKIARELAPEWPRACVELGRTLIEEPDGRNLDEGASHLRRALQLDPEDEASHYYLAQALSAKGDFRGSLPHYRRTLDRFTFARSELAFALFKAGELDEAFTVCLEAMDKLGAAQDSLLFMELHQVRQKLRQAQELVDAQPENARLYHELGCALTAANKSEEATKAFKKARELGYEEPEA